MQPARSSGQVAALLQVTEPRINDLIRRGRISPPPSIVSGRRVWEPAHIRQAAAALGVPVPVAVAETAGSSTAGSSTVEPKRPADVGA